MRFMQIRHRFRVSEGIRVSEDMVWDVGSAEHERGRWSSRASGLHLPANTDVESARTRILRRDYENRSSEALVQKAIELLEPSASVLDHTPCHWA